MKGLDGSGRHQSKYSCSRIVAKIYLNHLKKLKFYRRPLLNCKIKLKGTHGKESKNIRT